MVCKKSELVSAINSFGSARASGDGNLIVLSANLLGTILDTIEFSPEDTEEDEVAEPTQVTPVVVD